MEFNPDLLSSYTIERTELTDVTPKQLAYANWYMDLALRTAEMSHCVRRKVGSLIEVDGSPISFGFNGKPPGFNNICELPGQNVTDPLTRHAERNTLDRFMTRSDFTHNATMYVTLSPCLDCSITIVTRAKLQTVYFKEMYRDVSGVAYLILNNVDVYQLIDSTIYKLSVVK